ncbi:MAG: sulfatase family protein [Bacteroidales bacterium]
MKKTILTSIPIIAASHSLAQDKLPNIVIIYADDIGYGDLSCYGTSKVETPNVDRLAKGGIRFTNAHSTAATSTPSRYSLLTGEYPFRNPDSNIADGDASMIIKPGRRTVATMMQEAGYTTGAVGKWHLGIGEKEKQDWNGIIQPGLRDIGFDYSFIMAATGDRVPTVYIENQRCVDVDPTDPIEVSYIKNFEGEPTGKNNPELLFNQKPSHGHDGTIVNGISRIGFMKGGHSARWKDEEIADRITDKAVEFINNNTEHPFFLYFGTNDIHVPRFPNSRFVGKSGMGPRGDAILQFDYCVGRVISTLEKQGILNNTMIIISSDNGPILDDGYLDQSRELLGDHKPSGELRGNKYSCFEAGTRVPFIVHWTNKIDKGSTSQALVSHIDFMGTMAQLVGSKLTDESPDSQGQLRAWLGEDKKGRDYIIEMAADRTLSLRTKEWKVIEPSISKGVTINPRTLIETGYKSTPQIYNLKRDPSESIDLANREIKRCAEMLSTIELERQNKN